MKVEEVGAIDSERLLAFVWRIAGRGEGKAVGWVRERALKMVLDNYSVHKSALVKQTQEELERAGIELVYLPSYSPELSLIEPVWNDVKQHQLSVRSFEEVVALKQAVDTALERKDKQLRQSYGKTTSLQRAST